MGTAKTLEDFEDGIRRLNADGFRTYLKVWNHLTPADQQRVRDIIVGSSRHYEVRYHILTVLHDLGFIK